MILFLEAVARVTPAFQELREQLLPRCEFSRNHVPLEDLDTWFARWHLNFSDYELHEMVESWTHDVLRDWARNAERAHELNVDCGYWERLNNRSRRTVAERLMWTWDPQREPFEDWDKRARRMKEQQEDELRKYDATLYRPENLLTFEYLALSICSCESDGKIAMRYKTRKVTREAVKKARTRLAKRLHIVP